MTDISEESISTLQTILGALSEDEPPALEVADKLADATAISPTAAYEQVTDAIDAGVLIEEGNGFGGVRLAPQYRCDDEPSKIQRTDDLEGGGAGCSDSNPGGIGSEHTVPEAGSATVASWEEIDFTDPEPQVWAPDQIARDTWMNRKDGKNPFAPWADPNAPVECSKSEHDEDTTCAECRHSAQYKWGSDGSHEHVHGTYENAREWSEMDPTLSSDLVFIQRESDPFAFVDGDDVRDPETGEVHPAFQAVLEHLGLTYADVSTSESGIHAVYRGEIPLDGVNQAKFEIDDEPWGANDDVPEVEIYDGKHVCIATGDHLRGSGTEITEWDADSLTAVLQAHGYEDRPEPSAGSSPDLEDHDPDATSSTETTDDIRDVFYALDRIDARRVADEMIVHAWNEDANTSGGNRAFVPSWGRNANGTANIVDDEIWQDTGGDGYGGPDVIAAIDCPDLPSYDERTQPRDLKGGDWFRAIEHLRDAGYDIPELETSSDDEEYRRDPRDVQATVDPHRAWDAAGRVRPDDLGESRLRPADSGERFACPDCGESIDVVRAVAIEDGLIDACSDSLDNVYPEAYAQARTEYGAPLPEYYTVSDAIAEFDAVLDVISEVTFFDLNIDALSSEITAREDEVSGDAVRALDPFWRESESGESVLVFESGAVWDADTERVLDALRFVALDSGLLSDPTEPLKGETFTEAYRRCRIAYGAPLPRWEPAADGAREITAQLPPSKELVDTLDLDGVDVDALDQARADVEALIREATTDSDAPTVVTTLPATGKTTGTVKTAQDRPLSYLAPRKELQEQAVQKAHKWDVDPYVLPVFSEQQVDSGILSRAVSHVREQGKSQLRNRWTIVTKAIEEAEEEQEASEDDEVDTDDLFVDSESDVNLIRATCPTAEGRHGVAWALAVHVARDLGYTPREIHQQAQGLFGAELPCTCSEDSEDSDDDEGRACAYSQAWRDVADPDNPPDLLIGSYGHAHVPSVRTAYDRDGSGEIVRSDRAVVLDEFIGEAYTTEFGENATDYATWLARSLRGDIEDTVDVYETDLYGDEWVRAWLNGDGGEIDAVDDALLSLGRVGDLFDAQEAAENVLDEVDESLLKTFDLLQPLEQLTDGVRADKVFAELQAALGNVDRSHPASGIAGWVDDAVQDPLANATDDGATAPSVEGIDVDALPVDGELWELVESAVEAVRDGAEGADARVRAAATALRGGPEGCRRLAAWADDGYAHPDAHHILQAIITPTGDEDAVPDASRVQTSSWAFEPGADGTILNVVDTTETATTIVDRNGHGARIHTPPGRTHAGGGEVPLVGLDATARAELWRVALGETVDIADIHDSAEERAAFLQDALDLRVLQASERSRYYSGDPTSKDTDGDVALLKTIQEEYSGITAPRQRGEEPDEIGNPATITSLGVKNELMSDQRLDGVVAEWEHFGNLTGANDLGDHRLAAVLGCQHYGDDAIERFAALEGEELDTDRRGGRGANLDYGSDLANAYLKHMSEDQVMQAVLRFARGDSGATVVARTSALRPDLPIVGAGQVVKTWSETATKIARAYRRLSREFTAADVRDAVDVGKRQVRRVLRELVDAGYINRVSSDPGVASVYEPVGDPGAGEVDLPSRDRAVTGEAGHTPSIEYHTWNVRVFGGEPGSTPVKEPTPAKIRGAPPAPSVASETGPPG